MKIVGGDDWTRIASYNGQSLDTCLNDVCSLGVDRVRVREFYRC